MIATDVPEEQHAEMRALQGRHFIEAAAEQLYFAAWECRADGVPWPADLDSAHELLWLHLRRDPDLRRQIIGPVEEEAELPFDAPLSEVSDAT